MVKINSRLLPIKAHFFFFMSGMGPILPQLSVIGKQIGISAEIMGVITSIIPIMYVLAKPIFGFLVDYFSSFRKGIFMFLIIGMTVAFGSFYFIPSQTHAIDIEKQPSWPVSFEVEDLNLCNEKLMAPENLCHSTRRAKCSNNLTTFEVYVTAPLNPQAKLLNVTDNVKDSETQFHLCVANSSDVFPPVTKTFNGTCEFLNENQMTCLYSSWTFWFFVLLMCVGTIGYNVVNSISDAICFDMLGPNEESKYGYQRVWGTIGFGVTALLAGFVVNLWTADTVKSFTPALVIMFIFSGFDLLSVSKVKLPKLSSSESIFKDVWSLVTQPAISIFLVFATIAGIIDSFLIYFMFWHAEEVAAETGFKDQIKLIEGCVVAAECLASEVPFFFYSGKIIKKLGYVHCMSMCFFFYAVRLAFISWIPNPWYLVLVELFFQGVTYALCYTCIVAYASEVAPPGTSATVQGLMAGMDDGLGFSIGSLIGGLTIKTFGSRKSFQYFAIAAFCTCLLHILVRPSSKKKQYPSKDQYQTPSEQQQMAAFKAETKVF